MQGGMGGPGLLIKHGDITQIRCGVRILKLLFVAARHVRALRVLAVDQFQT